MPQSFWQAAGSALIVGQPILAAAGFQPALEIGAFLNGRNGGKYSIYGF